MQKLVQHTHLNGLNTQKNNNVSPNSQNSPNSQPQNSPVQNSFDIQNNDKFYKIGNKYTKLQQFTSTCLLYLPAIVKVLLCACVINFTLFMLIIAATIFDAPSKPGTNFETIFNCIIIAFSFFVSGNGFAFSVPLFGDVGVISINTLGITLFNIFMIYMFFKRFDKLKLRVVFVTSLVYTAFIYFLYCFANLGNAFDVFFSVPLPFIMSFMAISFATFTNVDGSFFRNLLRIFQTNKYLNSIPKYIILGIRGSIIYVALMLIITTCFFLYAEYSTLQSSEEIFHLLNSSPYSAISITLLVLCFIPNLIIFSLSMLMSNPIVFGTNVDANSLFIPPLPIFSSVMKISELSLYENILSVFYYFSFFALVCIFYFVSKRIGDALLFEAFTKISIVVSQTLLLLASLISTCIFIFCGLFFLGFVSSGRIGDNIGYFGVNKVSFSVSFLGAALLAIIVIILHFIIKKSLKINNTNIILIKEASAKRSVQFKNVDKERAMNNAKKQKFRSKSRSSDQVKPESSRSLPKKSTRRARSFSSKTN